MSNHPQSPNTFSLLVLITAALIALAAGFQGFGEFFTRAGQPLSISDQLYYTASLFFWEFNVPNGDNTVAIPVRLEVARWLAPMTLLAAAAKALLALLGDQLQRLKLSLRRNHAVIMGLDNLSMHTLRSLRKSRIAVTVVCADPSNPWLGLARKLGASILINGLSDPSALKLSAARRARWVLLATGSDRFNLNLLNHLYQAKLDSGVTSMRCAIEIQQIELAEVLYQHPAIKSDYDTFTAMIVNRHKRIARAILQQHGPEQWLALANPSSKQSSIAIAGDLDLIEQLVVQLAALGHYGFSEPLRVAIIHPQAKSWCEQLVIAYPALPDIIDLQALELSLSFMHRQQCLDAVQQLQPTVLYLCTEHDDQLLIWQETIVALEPSFPVLVADLGDQNEPDPQSSRVLGRFQHMKGLTDCFNYQSLFNIGSDRLAKAIHDDYVAARLGAGDLPATNSSLVPWNKLPESLKDANRHQADHLNVRCHIIESVCGKLPIVDGQLQIDKALLNRLAKVEHQRWVAEKLLTGWQYTSGEKDSDRRLSPWLIPWEQLPDTEKIKDVESVKLMPSLLKLLADVEKT